ncbi:unnamed protein product [Periconia digitata]|uniref:Rhodopsin domain-containing protein n=1 Tax=Periconia digitata TaxID=1303443 RepID=A0A9W4XR85_9PLEO|nr:unnamed protein product [Periconia digitata]
MVELSKSPEWIGWQLIAWAAIFTPLQIAAVALRFYARWLVVGKKYSLDDYLIIASLVFQLAACGIAVSSVKYGGVGHHILYIYLTDQPKLVVYNRYIISLAFLCGATVNIPKLAVLLLYKRLFGSVRTYRIIIWTFIGILLCMTLGNIISASVSCIPFEANWKYIRGAKCLEQQKWFSYIVIPNIITDVFLLILPLPIVWTLHTSRHVKAGLTVTFLIGSAGLGASILRLVAFVSAGSFIDGTWVSVKLMILAITETGTYLICACLLTYRPILERITKGRKTTTTEGSRYYFSRSHLKQTADSVASPEQSYRSIPLRGFNGGRSGFSELHGEENDMGFGDVESHPGKMGRRRDGEIMVTTEIQNRWSR